MDNINVDVRLIKQIGSVKVVMLKGEAGSSIESIEKTSTEGLVDTYTITLTDGSHTTFQVTNGSSIATIEKTASIGNTDVYTITLTDGSTSTFEVVNGDNWIDNGEKVATDFFETITGGKLSKCEIALSPVQSGSGDPSPDNIRPISGHTEVDLYNVGKNRLPLDLDYIKSINTSGIWNGDVYTYRGCDFTFIKDVDGKILEIKVKGTATGGNVLLYLLTDRSLTFSSQTILSGCPSGGTSERYRLGILLGDQNRADYGDGYTISENAIINNSYIRISNGYSIENELTFLPMIRLSTETDPTFEPYLGHLYTVQIGSTVYGGSVDLVSGVGSVSDNSVDLGSLNYTYDSANQRFYTDDLTNINISYNARRTPFICSCYQAITDGRPITDVPNGSVYNASYNKRIYIHDSRYTVPSDFKTALSGQTLVYPLATPQTIQLTPQQIETLVGENHLSTPLSGQSIVENGVTYRYLFTWDDINGIIDDVNDRIDDIEDVLAETSYTSAVSCLVDDTTCTITDTAIKTTSLIEVFSSNTSGDTTVVTNIAVTTGQAVLTFDALVEATSFKLRITNL